MRKILLQALLAGTATQPVPRPTEDMLREIAAALRARPRPLPRGSLAIREVDAGSCNGCELEINALGNPVYDLERLGLRFVASPRHADVLLVTGPVTHNMREALLRTYDATPEPRWVVAAGDCAHDCGVFGGAPGVFGRVSDVLPVDLHIRGCPPTPLEMLRGLQALLRYGQGADA